MASPLDRDLGLLAKQQKSYCFSRSKRIERIHKPQYTMLRYFQSIFLAGPAVPASRFSTESVGASRPVSHSDSAVGW